MIVDAYAHVGLPRFQSLADYEAAMASAGIDRAVLVGFDSSPDLPALHDGLSRRPADFRAIGFPIGRDRDRMEAAARAQLAAGFSGLRLTESDLLERPWLLELVGSANGTAIVVGRISTTAVAEVLLAHLARHPEANVVGGHFAGPTDAGALASGPVAELFAHPRFFVIWSRHGGYESDAIERWAETLIGAVGWDRLLWGSEAPVLYWRNETIQTALAWVDRFSPSDAERAAFVGGNAERVFFGDSVRVGELTQPFDLADDAAVIPAGLFANGVAVDQRLAGRLVHAWLADGGAASGPLGSYLETILDRALPAGPDPAGQF